MVFRVFLAEIMGHSGALRWLHQLNGWMRKAVVSRHQKKDGHAVGWKGHYTTMEIDDVDDGGS